MSRKEKMKVYHGIPKSVTDEHTLLYVSGEDTNYLSSPIKYTTSSPTGYGIKLTTSDVDNYYNFNQNVTLTENFTIEFFIKKPYKSNTSAYSLLTLDTSKGSKQFIYIGFIGSTNKLVIGRFSDTYSNCNGTINLSEDFNHIRIGYSNSILKIYANGKLDTTYNIKLNTEVLSCPIFIGSFAGANGAITSKKNEIDCIFDDLHISNIDRGDYFPNLPQDFIEGKAIIKERLGQQQIKGDPLISQTTELIVPSNVEDSGNYSKVANADGTFTHNEKPELACNGASLWHNGAKIRISALNNEIISGVIDSDTALARVFSSTGNTLFVDDVSKFTVGDTISAWKPSTGHIDIVNRVVSSIDTVNKSVTFTGTVWKDIDVQAGWNVVVETTTTTSTPIVKTTDGTVVNGTWTGLGTSQALFTTSNNSPLPTGKDLVVTYSLNIPPGNSHFPELPSDIERAYTETGIEMKPVNEIVIEDDFKGKKEDGSTKECPHICKYIASTTLKKPSEFTSSTDGYYYKLQNLDSVAFAVSNNGQGVIPQTLFSFNLIEMVERKIGTIPSADKVQWLKNNLHPEATIFHYGYGVSNLGNRLMINWWNASNSSWTINSRLNTSSSVALMTDTTSALLDRIDPNGFVHLLAYTDPSNTTVTSIAYTDYVYLKIQLKMDSTFTTLYCDNKRAREDKCNPVLIQKETKTVKRYIPSKECFVTENKYVKVGSAGNISGDSLRERLVADDYIYVTSLGTGDYGNTTEYYRNCVSYIGDAYIKSITPMLTGQTLSTNLVSNNIKFTRVLSDSNNNDNRYLLPKEQFTGNYVCVKPFLMSKGKELNITLSVRYIKNGVNTYHTELEYTLPNRPLIK